LVTNGGLIAGTDLLMRCAKLNGYCCNDLPESLGAHDNRQRPTRPPRVEHWHLAFYRFSVRWLHQLQAAKMNSIDPPAQERASFPLEHYRQAILCKEAYPWARRYLAALQSAAHRDVLAAVPPRLQRPVQLIAEAVECGWFVVPNGKNRTFSARQFAERSRMAAALPWLPDIL